MTLQRYVSFRCDVIGCDAVVDVGEPCPPGPPGWLIVQYAGGAVRHICPFHTPPMRDCEHSTLEDMSDKTKLGGIER